MKTRYLTLLFTLFIFLLLGSLLLRMPQFAATNRSNEPIPYIYYYSDLQQAWVIERADGTDSRLLGQGVMPKDHDVIVSADWSPSGEWLAWTSSEWSLGGVSPKGWLVSTDGRQVSHLLDDTNDVFLMTWAPNKDWLVVGFEGHDSYSYQVLRLIDVPNQVIVADIKQHGTRYYEPPQRIGVPRAWSEDGKFVYSTFGAFDSYTVSRLDMTGHLETWAFDSRYPLMSFGRERMMRERWEHRNGTSYKEWFITDLSTDEEYIFASIPSNEVIELRDYDLLWNNQRTHAFVTAKQCDEEAFYQCEEIGQYILDWENRSQYLIPDNYEIPRNDYYPQSILWSLSGRFLVLEDASKSFYLLDSSNGEIFDIGLNNLEWHWLDDDKLVFYSGNDKLFYLFNAQTRELSENHLDEDLSTFFGFDISDNGNTIGYFDEDVIVENIDTEERFSYPAHSSTIAYVTGYQWGDNPEWFFSGGNTSMGGGGFNSIAIMIHNLHEATGRELTICDSVDTCVGFLPDNVLPNLARGQTESLTPAPSQLLLHDNTVHGVAWNSDGSRLATYAGAGTISIWNMQAQEAYLDQSFETNLRCDFHPMPCPIAWIDGETIRFLGRDPENTHPIGNNAYQIQEVNLLTRSSESKIPELPHPFRLLSQNERYEIVFSGENNSIAHLQDTQTKTLVSQNPLSGIRDYNIFQFDYHPETGLLVGSSVYDRGGLWDVATGEQIARLNWTGYAVAFSPDGMQLAVAGSEFVTIGDMSEYIDNR